MQEENLKEVNLKEENSKEVELKEELKQDSSVEEGSENGGEELAEAKERLLRIHADFDNYRKRVNKEKEEWFQYSCMGLVEKLLPVLDNFDLAMDSLEQQNEEVKKIFSGISMIVKQLKEILQNEGLEPIQAVGENFDPLFHEAVMQVPAEDEMMDNQIVEEMRKGYRFKEKVLRASMVKVAKNS